MTRMTLIHWNATEAEQRAERLRRPGETVHIFTPRSGVDLRPLRENPPDAFVIDLSRLPSQGRDLGIWLRQRKATRHVPIVFVAGEAEKVARVRKQLPDAVYTEWRGIRSALRDAIRRRPRDPVVPGAMDGYAGTPMPKKLGIKPDSVVALLGAPPGFERVLGRLPEGVRLRKDARARSDLIVLFVKSRADLDRRFTAAKRALAERGSIWIAWPKKTSGVATNLTQREVRRVGLNSGLVDYKIAAIDATWSGLRFARRRARRASGRE